LSGGGNMVRSRFTAGSATDSSDTTARAVRWLVAQHRGRRAFTGFPPGGAPLDVNAAYVVQDAFVAAKAAACGPAIGWKIALSNPAMQAFVGLHEPVAGRLHRDQVVAAPARTRAAAYGRLLVEFEIAVELGDDLPARAAPYGRDEVAAAVVAVRPAYELADDRGADYATLSAHGLQLVADNAWNEGAVLGERRTDWRQRDLATIGGVVSVDGKEVGSGRGSALMGHPLDALAWLATHASRRGIGMRSGEIAILGSLVTSKFPLAGQQWVFELDGFAPLQLSID
jgi:2-keto-4-pentenoate hydratase